MTARLKEKSKDCKFFHLSKRKKSIKNSANAKKNLQDSFLFFTETKENKFSKNYCLIKRKKTLKFHALQMKKKKKKK